MNEPTLPPPAALASSRPTPTATDTTPTTTATPSLLPSSLPHPSSPQKQKLSPSSHGPGQTNPVIPVSLTEACLDSPSFRASAIHFADQLDALERWLDSYTRSTSKLVHDVLTLEDGITTYLAKIAPPPAIAAAPDPPVLDADYTLLGLRRAADAARDWWMGILGSIRRFEPVVVDPIRSFLQGPDMRAFRDARKALDVTQRAFDGVLARYMAQSKTKEPSALREDAFAVYEARRAYLKASLDYCMLAPQVRAGLDRVLVRVSADLEREMRRAGEEVFGNVARISELERIRGWSKEMEIAEGGFRRELQMARRDLGENTLAAWKPSRELEDYSVSTVPYLGSRGPQGMQQQQQQQQQQKQNAKHKGNGNGNGAAILEKQGWLFLRVMAGKPVRTTWIRRWYYCRDGVFGWLAQGPNGVLMGDEIGVLLCSARPAVQEERRFCFEIKTKTQTILLQAETQAQLVEWLEVFETAKNRYIEASMKRHQKSVTLPVGMPDPAFSVTPPSIPDFSAKILEGLDEGATSVVSGEGKTLSVPGQEAAAGARQSFDVPRRALTTALARDEGDSGRDHATRIMQKLDLHRTKTVGPSATDATVSGTTALGSGGGLLLPGNTTATSTTTLAHGQQPPLLDPHYNARPKILLAPTTLVKPPILTSLSKTAVLASANAGGAAATTAAAARSLPSAAIANYWGSNSYSSVYCSIPTPSPGPHTPRPDNVADPFSAAATAADKSSAASGSSMHRKTFSADAATVSDISRAAREKASAVSVFPENYPSELRAQYAQFRLLFPAAPAGDMPVLVFNAVWTSTPAEEVQDVGGKRLGLAGNGRIFVTPDRMYFYGHHLGLVVPYILGLDAIAEITAARGRDCDTICLHLSQSGQDTAMLSRITIKVFLDDVASLQARLNLLVDDLQAAEPMELAEIVAALATIDACARNDGDDEDGKRSPSVESWEEVSSNPPLDDTSPTGRLGMTATASLRRVQELHGVSSSGKHGRRLSVQAQQQPVKKTHKLHLPTHPVVYEPEDMGKPVAERHFEVSAKSCFHVLFGDRSALFPKLYFERGARNIAQGPWKLQDHGVMRREFRFTVDGTGDMLGRRRASDVIDFQTIDVFRDHMAYVVSHVKIPWHLPHYQSLRLVVKVVITHLAKSKCKLAIYVRPEWLPPSGRQLAPVAFARNLVQRQALDDAVNDAEELADLVTEHVRRLGPHTRRTRRAIQVYGEVGQVSDAIKYSPPPPAEDDEKKTGAGGVVVQAVRPRTMADMLLDSGRSFLESVISSVMMWAFAAVRRVFGVLSAHRVILVLLAISAAHNLVIMSQAGSTWWVERRAARYMRRLGVGPNLVMGRAVYLKDLEEAARGSVVEELGDDGGVW